MWSLVWVGTPKRNAWEEPGAGFSSFFFFLGFFLGFLGFCLALLCFACVQVTFQFWGPGCVQTFGNFSVAIPEGLKVGIIIVDLHSGVIEQIQDEATLHIFSLEVFSCVVVHVRNMLSLLIRCSAHPLIAQFITAPWGWYGFGVVEVLEALLKPHGLGGLHPLSERQTPLCKLTIKTPKGRDKLYHEAKQKSWTCYSIEAFETAPDIPWLVFPFMLQHYKQSDRSVRVFTFGFLFLGLWEGKRKKKKHNGKPKKLPQRCALVMASWSIWPMIGQRAQAAFSKSFRFMFFPFLEGLFGMTLCFFYRLLEGKSQQLKMTSLLMPERKKWHWGTEHGRKNGIYTMVGFIRRHNPNVLFLSTFLEVLWDELILLKS